MDTSSGMSILQRLDEYRHLARIDEIGRRYFAMNAFDGILTMLGVVMGAYIGGIDSARVVFTTGLATSMAMGVSGLWGAYMTESAERKHSLRELEQAMLADMQNTKQARASRFAVVVVALIDGLAPLVAGGLVILPFILSGLLPDIITSYIASTVLALALLFALGAFLAKVGHSNLVHSGFRMILAGLVCVGLSFLLGSFGAGA